MSFLVRLNIKETQVELLDTKKYTHIKSQSNQHVIGQRGSNDVVVVIEVDWLLNSCKIALCQTHVGIESRGVHSLLYFAYTCVRDLFIMGVIYLAKKL